jgi:citrate lyase beta subunit
VKHRPRGWRAPLFAPGDSERKITKAAALGADAVILDLEDAVVPANKAPARATVRSALATLDFGRTARLVRINAVGSGFERGDLEETIAGCPDAYMLPKAESGETLREVALFLAELEARAGIEVGTTRLVALIETARGVIEAPHIAAADPRLVALCFGAEDYCASVGALRSAEGVEVLWGRSATVAAAAANGLDAIDTPFVDLHDTAGLAKDAAFARQLGYTGKLAIHPAQIAPLHAAVTPTADEIERARRLLDAYAEHTRAGTGVFAFEGRMVDTPMIRAAERIVTRAG